MAYYRKRKIIPKTHHRRTQRKQIRKKQPTKRARKTTTKKTNGKKMSAKAKGCQFTKKARGVLSSCVEGLCHEVYSEANRLREKSRQPTITREVLLNALEQSLAKGNVRRSLTEGTKKMRKKKLVDTTRKTRKTADKRAAVAKVLQKPRKASHVFQE